MATITNPTVIKHCNEIERKVADLLKTARRTLEEYQLLIVRDFKDIVGVDGAGNANGDVIVDGSAEDGRTQITKQRILALEYVANQTLAALQANDAEAVVEAVAVNGNPLF